MMMRGWIVFMFVCCAGVRAQATDNAYASGWGPALHTAAPAINAPDQHGEMQTFKTLVGRNGLLLLFVRSADW